MEQTTTVRYRAANIQIYFGKTATTQARKLIATAHFIAVDQQLRNLFRSPALPCMLRALAAGVMTALEHASRNVGLPPHIGGACSISATDAVLPPPRKGR